MDHEARPSGEASGPDAGEGSGKRSPEGRWMTYGELGRIRGIGRESAVKLAQRKRWRRIPGNDGIARVLVPLDWLVPAKDASPDHSPEPSGEPSPILAAFEAALAAVREAKDGEIATLRQQVERLAAQADAERTRADALRDRIEDLQGRLGQSEAEGAAADVQTAQLTAQLKQARAEAQAAAEAAADMRQADDERQGRGRWARIRAAWRGS